MSPKQNPKVGNWYESADSQSFRVVGVDEASATIEIQYLDGSLEDIDFDAWSGMNVEAIIPPKDWEGLCDEDIDDYLNDDYVDDDPANDESWDQEEEVYDEDMEINDF